MKPMTASMMKGTRYSHYRAEPPREGTILRGVYDNFMSSKGLTIKISKVYYNARIIDSLTDYYGLDIRRVGRGKYCLVGEWFGLRYVDYLAERIAKEYAAESEVVS